MLQNATPLRKSAPWPPNISDEHVFCTAPATRNASLKILFKCPTPAIAFGNATKLSRFAHFWQGAQSLAPATRKHIWTSKSAPYLSVFCTFDLEMCFAPQRRALFRHLNFQKWREHVVLLTFWLRHVLCATTACTFSTSQLLKVVRRWCALYILTWKCASRQNGVHFFDLFRHLNYYSTTKSGPTLVCFVHFDLEMCFCATTACTFSTSQLPKVVRRWCVLCFLTWKCASRHNGDGSAPTALASLLIDPPELQTIGKTQCLATFLPFRAPAPSCFWLFLFSDLLSSDSFSSLIFSSLSLSLLTLSLLWFSLFYSSLLSDSSHRCFSSVHIGGSLASKLPSMIQSRKRTKAWHRRKWTRLDWRCTHVSPRPSSLKQDDRLDILVLRGLIFKMVSL